MSEESISVLVSVTDQAGDIPKFHDALIDELNKLGEEYEVLYLLGASPEPVVQQVLSVRETNPEKVRVLRFAEAVGRAGQLSGGIEQSQGGILLTLSARFEVDFGVIAELHQAVLAGVDLAFASRQRGHTGVSARMQSELFNRLVSTASGRTFRDIASETRAIRREVLTETPLYGDFYRYLPLLAERLGFRVQEIPAEPHPEATASAVQPLRIYFWRAIDVLSIFFISRFTRHPLRLFGGVGAAFATSGLGILAIVALQRFAGTPLADRPVLVLATLLVGLGVQAFTIGLLAELILFFQGRAIRDYRIAAVYEGTRTLKAVKGGKDD